MDGEVGLSYVGLREPRGKLLPDPEYMLNAKYFKEDRSFTDSLPGMK